jgi:hypothetical protein
VRTLLVTIAVIAVVFAAWSFRRLSQQHAAVAARHRKAQWEVSQQRDILAKGVSRRKGASYNPDEALKFARSAWEAEVVRERVAMQANFAYALRKRVHELTELANYHATMQHKYERAAQYPWLSVAPDPPKPE